MRLVGHVDSGSSPTLDSEAVDGGYDRPTSLRTEETRARTANAAAMPTQASPCCVGRGAHEVGLKVCD